jgi:hypothetical protein
VAKRSLTAPRQGVFRSVVWSAVIAAALAVAAIVVAVLLPSYLALAITLGLAGVTFAMLSNRA